VSELVSAVEKQPHSSRSIRQVMALVLLALVPAIAVDTAIFGVGALMQMLLAIVFALPLEACMLIVRRQTILPFLTDLSAVLTAVLFALLVPATAPWWVAALGMTVAIVFAKHLFGGLGENLFNPAIAGLVAVKLCFPRELHSLSVPAEFTGTGAYWLALAYAAGGFFLLWKKIIHWQAPAATMAVAMLSATAWSLLAANAPPSAPIDTAFWLLAAFFIVTDPVTGCITARGRLVFGAGVGAVGTAIGCWRHDPHGFAFAVLLMNCLVPWIDRHSRKRARATSPTPADSTA
jgi:electron transport complex protein RnfD